MATTTTTTTTSAAQPSAATTPKPLGRQLFILISVPRPDRRTESLGAAKSATSSTPATVATAGALQEHLRDSATCGSFDIPQLSVGTQDTLMLLSDELSKLEAFSESTTRRIAQQYDELTGKPSSHELPIRGENAETYLTQFQWEDAKYAPRAPLKETTARINQQITRLDEELRTKSMAYNNLARDIAAEQRKEGTSLVTKSLTDIVPSTDLVETEYLTTLLVAVPKVSYKEWLNTYEKLTQFVLPGSSKLITEDNEYGLYTVVLFKRVAEDYKNLAREKRFTVRDFSIEQLSDKYKQARKKKLEERDNQQRQLLRWCRANFVEAFLAWVHIKVIRTFVESVLRYGLPAYFSTIIIKPKKDEKRVMTSLGKIYESLADKKMLSKDKPDEADKEEFMPFVYSIFDCDFSKQL